MIVKNVEIMRFGEKYGKNRIIPLTKSVDFVTILNSGNILNSQPEFFGEIGHQKCAGGIIFNQLAIAIRNPYLSNWCHSIFAEIEILSTPFGIQIAEFLRSNGKDFRDFFVVTPYEIGMNEEIILLGFIVSERKS